MIDQTTGIQYEIMTNGSVDGKSYVPNFDELIAEAPNEEIAHQWKRCGNLIESTKDSDFSFDGFAFPLVCCVLQTCGHYEIFQYPYNEEYDDIEEIMQEFANENRRCTRCICG